tara:strand:- start:42 stop:281 length:240 start_codon:yes stop_codon:yes gene_type:complete
MTLNYKKYIPQSELPEHEVKRVGYKVSWYSFKNEEDAKKASEIAKNNAAIDASHGYDFGYLCPGTIEEEEDGTFTVIFP